MNAKITRAILFGMLILPLSLFANPIKGLLERIDEGASKKFIIEIRKSNTDFF